MRSFVIALLFLFAGAVAFVTLGSIPGALVGSLALFGWLMTRRRATSLLGATCARCGDGIYIEGQADRCAVCSAPLHARCIDAHTREGHAGASPPYR
jgi:hypothetical protein